MGFSKIAANSLGNCIVLRSQHIFFLRPHLICALYQLKLVIRRYPVSVAWKPPFNLLNRVKISLALQTIHCVMRDVSTLTIGCLACEGTSLGRMGKKSPSRSVVYHLLACVCRTWSHVKRWICAPIEASVVAVHALRANHMTPTSASASPCMSCCARAKPTMSVK